MNIFDRLKEKARDYDSSEIPNSKRVKRSKLLSCVCVKTKKRFIIRLDKKGSEKYWHAAYAFPSEILLGDDTAIVHKREKILIGDNLPEYNGCPFCGGNIFAFCSCGNIFCSNIDKGYLKCPVCNKTDYYTPAILHNVRSFTF